MVDYLLFESLPILDDDANDDDGLSGGKSSVCNSLDSGLMSVSGLVSFSFCLICASTCLCSVSCNFLYGLFTSIHQFFQYHIELCSFLCLRVN